MGKLNACQAGGRPMEPKKEEEAPEPQTLTHISHQHVLSRTVQPPMPPNMRAVCDGCWLPFSGVSYACLPCDFVLHKQCAMAPRSLRHAGHPVHELAFIVKPPYPDGGFCCDACGQQGTGFCFRCGICGFDLHIHCAMSPQQVKHPSHQHPLNLLCTIPYPNKSFSCDVCGGNGAPTRWLYHCTACGFDAHLHCATGHPSPALPAATANIQHASRSPAATMQPPPLASPYAEVLEQQRQEFEQLAAFLRAQTALQERMNREIQQTYLRPITGYPPGTSVDALMQQLSSMGLNNGGGANYQALLQQLAGGGGGGGGGVDLSGLLGQFGDGGSGLISLASLFFS